MSVFCCGDCGGPLKWHRDFGLYVCLDCFAQVEGNAALLCDEADTVSPEGAASPQAMATLSKAGGS